MNGMILAAGLGTRLGDLGRSIPKVLIEVGGRPLLCHQLDFLYAHGVDRVIINTHHLAPQVASFVEAYNGPAEVSCVFEERLLGTAGAVRNVLCQLQPGPFVVLYGDVLVREHLHPMFAYKRAAGATAVLAVHRADSSEGKGVVETDDRGRVTRFAEKAAKVDGPALINSGVYVLDSEIVATIPRGTVSDFGLDVFPQALAAGQPIYAFVLSEPVVDIGTAEGLALARSRARRSTTGGRPSEV